MVIEMSTDILLVTEMPIFFHISVCRSKYIIMYINLVSLYQLLKTVKRYLF
jgi:hypothetical protein